MKEDVALISHESMLRDLIDQQFVIREPKVTWVKTDDVRKYLGISENKWLSKKGEITAILKALGWQECQIKRTDETGKAHNWKSYQANELEPSEGSE
jgi:hypothetical protein